MNPIAKQAVISILICACTIQLIWIGVSLILWERSSYQNDPFSAVNDFCAFLGWVKVVVGSLATLGAIGLFVRTWFIHSRSAATREPPIQTEPLPAPR